MSNKNKTAGSNFLQEEELLQEVTRATRGAEATEGNWRCPIAYPTIT